MDQLGNIYELKKGLVKESDKYLGEKFYKHYFEGSSKGIWDQDLKE